MERRPHDLFEIFPDLPRFTKRTLADRLERLRAKARETRRRAHANVERYRAAANTVRARIAKRSR
jgi:hypothetical protein